MIHKITFLFVLFFTINTVNSQTVVKELKTVQVLTPQTFYLNGGNRATFGGKSRETYTFKLPPNTVEWYYAFTTSTGADPTQSIKLMAQLTRIIDPSGFTEIATSAILTPSGAAVCDIYLMDPENTGVFINKDDNWGSTLIHHKNYYRGNYKNGTVQIKDMPSKTYCLGFKNPSAVQGINITFEVVAIVDTSKKTITDEQLSKAQTYADLGWKAYERGEYEKCMELSKKAIELNPELGWVHNNIGLVYLINKNYMSAIDSYGSALEFFRKDTTNTKLWLTEAINDLKRLIAKHGELEGVRDIAEMIIAERKKLK
jgi:hypothetical protein